MRALYLIIAHHSRGYEVLERVQRETWADRALADVLWIHMEGARSTHRKGRQLIVPGRDTFDSILHKTLEAIRWSLDEEPFDFIVRSNLSTYFYPPLFDSQRFADRTSYAGYRSLWMPTPGSRPVLYISGAGIVLGRESAAALASARATDWIGVPDDVAIASILKSNSIHPQHAERVTIPDGDLLRPSFNTRLKITDDWPVTETLMRMAHRIYFGSDLESALRDFDRLQRNAVSSRGHLAARQALTRRQRIQEFQRTRWVGAT